MDWVEEFELYLPPILPFSRQQSGFSMLKLLELEDGAGAVPAQQRTPRALSDPSDPPPSSVTPTPMDV